MIEIFKKTYLAGADFAHKTWDEVEGRANGGSRRDAGNSQRTDRIHAEIVRRLEGRRRNLASRNRRNLAS